MADHINLLRNGEIVYDKATSESSVEELTDIVAAEYRAGAAAAGDGEAGPGA